MLWRQVPIPIKIRVFMWLTSKNRILTLDNLLKKGWQGNNRCQFCHQPETINHLFVSCSFTKQIWFFIGSCQQTSIQWNKFQILSILPNNCLHTKKLLCCLFSVLFAERYGSIKMSSVLNQVRRKQHDKLFF